MTGDYYNYPILIPRVIEREELCPESLAIINQLSQDANKLLRKPYSIDPKPRSIDDFNQIKSFAKPRFLEMLNYVFGSDSLPTISNKVTSDLVQGVQDRGLPLTIETVCLQRGVAKVSLFNDKKEQGFLIPRKMSSPSDFTFKMLLKENLNLGDKVFVCLHEIAHSYLFCWYDDCPVLVTSFYSSLLANMQLRGPCEAFCDVIAARILSEINCFS